MKEYTHLQFFVYGTKPKGRVKRLWTLLQLRITGLPSVNYPPMEDGSSARHTRVYVSSPDYVERVAAICYRLQPDSKAVMLFLSTLSSLYMYGIRFVIRDTATRQWFDNLLATRSQEEVNHIRTLMGPPALPEGYKWVRSKRVPRTKVRTEGVPR